MDETAAIAHGKGSGTQVESPFVTGCVSHQVC
jgi:hypothetical protein